MCLKRYEVINRFPLRCSFHLLQFRLFIYLFSLQLVTAIVIEPIGLVIPLLWFLYLESGTFIRINWCNQQIYLRYRSSSGWSLIDEFLETTEPLEIREWWSFKALVVIRISYSRKRKEDDYLFFLPDNLSRLLRDALKKQLVLSAGN
jgi:hypothetical protein